MQQGRPARNVRDARAGRDGLGPINRDTIDRYQTMAVMLLEDAPGVPGSGSRVAGIVTTLLLDLDINMVERAKLDEVLKEQVIQLTHADDANVLKVGKLVGAQAIIVGGVQQWERHEQSTNEQCVASIADDRRRDRAVAVQRGGPPD